MTELITMALPGVMSDDERRKLLHEAALAYTEGEEDTEAGLAVMRYAHESLCGHKIVELCKIYAQAVEARDDLARDARCWPDHYSDLDGADPETAAPGIAEDDIADTMNVLMFGSSAR
jgi:hypothetical protein